MGNRKNQLSACQKAKLEKKAPNDRFAAKVKLVEKQRKGRLLSAVRGLFNSFTAIFVVFLAVATISLVSAVNMLPTIRVNAPFFILASGSFLASFLVLCIMLRKYVSAYERAVAN